MKLYYSPYACSLSPHIVLREAGLAFTLERVDFATKLTATGADFRLVNPLGYVPALELEDGSVLTEGPAIVQYLADLAPASELAPPNGTMGRVRLQELLNFISTEVHKGFAPLFSPKANDEFKAAVRDTLALRFAHLDRRLATGPYLMGERFSVADAYLFTVLGWTRVTHIDLSPYPAIQAFQARMLERPAVKAALAAEKAKQ